ncbi:DCC1-like thiol-disulfide oxidoreductase family protein [Paracoccus sp. (in: a-proteobacteria)]|uniref:DCC1-like thiol-disulfide oxidoreductase family protein n=1 Tax=Paracoccus sp. TaxID=267 RepID=UPI0026DF9D01|nr:DCC1-like thiol-disulfide oxidoreductase family protein [Paracoccus sp. (in: a-proteobacteria)]MDO5646605.1 DCC1-like thiol-disulfide oxidoreductase family protein [Paracoccus sp. (in: a-proteobacteria)]
MTDENSLIEVVYDGECPFCADFTRMVALRRLGPVDLIDARGDDPRVAQIGAGLDLDRGMAVRHRGRVMYGDGAMAFLLAMSQPRGVWGLARWVFASPARGRLVYPVLVAGRRIVLRLLGRRPIGAKNRDAAE